CTERGKSFNRSAYLLRHRRIHAGERPYPCPKCRKTFTWNSHLNSHQKYGRKTPSRRRLRTGERPEERPACGKRFVRSSNLRRHRRIHTGEKPYPLSGKRFSVRSSLGKQQQLH
ncbi:UNVERIFIED_CONTAM: hypothetical protein FQV16_0004361, partial [Eudyptes robustus]